MILLSLALAAPRGLVVQVHDPELRLHGAPALRITDARGRPADIPLNDAGLHPDVRAGDGRWAGSGADLEGPYTLLLVDAAGGAWTGTLAAPSPAEPSLSVSPTADGRVVAREFVAEATPVVLPVATSSRRDGWIPLTIAWAGALGALAWAAGRRGRVPVAMTGLHVELPGRGLVTVRGDADAVVARLAETHRVVLAGKAPSRAVSEGMVFPLGPGRVVVEDILGALAELEGRGPPLVVVVTARLEARGGLRHAEALARLGRGLPGGVNAYVFGEADAAWVVDEGGRLRERALTAP